MTETPKRPKFYEVRELLPEELRSVYDALVGDYEFLAIKHHGKPFVSYKILADLVREGWRLPEATPRT
jgi:hypothetical protein